MFSSKLIAIDVGSSAVKLIETTAGKSHKLFKLGLNTLPEGTIVDGEIKDAKVLSEVTLQLLKDLNISTKGKRTCLSLGGGGILIRRAVVSIKEDQDLEEQIFYEAQQAFQHDMSDMLFWSQEFKSSWTPDDKRSFLFVGAKREMIDAYLDYSHSLQMKVAILDCSTISLANMFDHNYPLADMMVALIHVGSRSTQIILMYNGEFLYNHEFQIGGYDITQKISQNLGIDFHAAEALKIDVALGKQPINQEYQRAVGQVNDSIAMELAQTVRYYFQRETMPEGMDKLSYAFLAGGSSRALGLDAAIAAALRVPVQIVNPFHRMDAAKLNVDMNYIMSHGPIYSTACGLSLRRPNDMDQKIA